LPIIGVNTFLGGKESHATGGEQELMRSSDEEKDQQVTNVTEFREFHRAEAEKQLVELQQVARERSNTFEALMEAAKSCSLGSISHALYEVGGEYRRNM
jgi:methylmalonyl-CoA mutase